MNYLIKTIYIISLCWLPLSGYAQKIDGICVVGPFDKKLKLAPFEQIKASTQADWIAISPEAVLNRSNLSLSENHKDQSWVLNFDNYAQSIAFAKQAGLKVFIKPHIVVGVKQSNDKTFLTSWRGNLSMRKRKDWKVFEQAYRTYILKYAQLAQENNVDLFCIGTELNSFVKKRTGFWRQLIKEVRLIYDGPITYSSNWDAFSNVKFWNKLDFIGINSYFPVSTQKTPSTEKTLKNWQLVKRRLHSLSQRSNRPILFTEVGYRNVSFSGKRPWTHVKEQKMPQLNNEAQLNLFKAFFKSFWSEEWIAGAFIWNWTYKPIESDNTDFTIQNKPSQKEISFWFKK